MSNINQAIQTWAAEFSKDFHLNFIKENRYQLIIDGLGVTLQIAVCSIILGILIGFIIASMKLSKSKILNTIAYVYVDVIRGTPFVTQLLIMNFVIFATVSIDKVFVAIIAFGINSGAYVAEIIRAGILSVDKGQTEAGRSLGLSGSSTMLHIVIPQAIKNILPALSNEYIMLIKETAIVGYIAMADLTKAADIIRSRTYDAFMPLIGSAIIYYIIIKFFTIFLEKLERRLRKSDVR